MLTRLTEPRWRNDILLDVTWAKIAKRYFGKSPSWIYNKLNGTELVFLDNEACDDVARFVLVTDGDAYFVRAVLQDFRLENG